MIILIVQQINPLFGCNLSYENNIVTIMASVDNYFVLCILIFESPDLGDHATILQIDPVVSNRLCTTGRILYPSRYDL